MAKPAIVVNGRSYGIPRTIVKRGPQLVQFTNGYRKRRSSRSNSSARQSQQVALSGVTGASTRPSCELFTIANPASWRGATSSKLSSSSTASGGASHGSRARNPSIGSDRPSTSTSTPLASLSTKPARPHSRASRYTYGRKPTPCTIPRARTRTRRLPATSAAGASALTARPPRPPPARAVHGRRSPGPLGSGGCAPSA